MKGWKNAKNKKRYIYYICIILAVFSVFCFFYPTHIIEKSDEVKIITITYNPTYNTDCEKINTYIIEENKYNSQEISNCLYEYKEQRTLMRSNGYRIKNMELHIFLMVNGDSKDIVLGNDSFISRSNGRLKGRIINDVELRKELKKILNLCKGT